MKPQNYGSLRSRPVIAYFMGYPALEEERTCAWGGAVEAAGIKFTERSVDPDAPVAPLRGDKVTKGTVQEMQVPEQWLAVMFQTVRCPECSSWLGFVYRAIPHLNDDHHWSRWRIADFIEEYEGPSDFTENVAAKLMK
jgi:hypothetical protein